jgi:predicted phage terminase large subunit-like protein
MQIMEDLQKLRVDLLSDFFLFNRYIFKERTGRDFLISHPVSNESHFLEICRNLEDVFHGRTQYLAINCPPGWSKSELIKNFICWATAWYGNSCHLYISYSYDLAASHTQTIKQTMMLPIFRKLFDIGISRETSAKDFFKTTEGGAVAAFGSSGAITGRDAGLPGLDHYSGGVFIDDIHKPDEIHSDVIREKVKRNYIETIEPRCRGAKVPIVIIGQRLHQDDLFSYLLRGEDGNTWKHVNIKALDDAGNARYPEVLPREKLLQMKKYKPYVFASQYQQEPIPAGGGLYHESYFPLLDDMPDILTTFLTVDTAETEKEWNDKTVFSFWGLYPIKIKNEIVPDLYGLHWLNCWEMNLEPKDIEPEFLDFWASCMTFKIKPQCAIIEKKSTGVTLVSVLTRTQGIKIIGIDRTVKSGSKTQRFIDMQQYIAAKQISLPAGAKHTQLCLNHMTSITANNTHRFDDIADTCYDAVNAAFIDKIIVHQVSSKTDYNVLAATMTQGMRHTNFLRNKAHGSS